MPNSCSDSLLKTVRLQAGFSVRLAPEYAVDNEFKQEYKLIKKSEYQKRGGLAPLKLSMKVVRS